MPWLLNLIYLLILPAITPVLLWQRVVNGKRREGIWCKLTGRLVRRTGDRRLVWFHAVSVGEVLQLEPMIAECQRRWPSLEILVTTTTASGYRLAQQRFPNHLVDWFPLDFSWAVREALTRIRPDLVVLVELELWPNFILAAHRAGIPLALVNGRISDSSFGGYRKLKWLFGGLLKRLDRLLAQNETYAARLETLGAPRDRIRVSGSIKYDRIETRRDNTATRDLGRELGIQHGDPVFVAGSTQEPEERLAVEAYVAARETHPNLRLVLVPRHQERFDRVAEMVESMGQAVLRRTRLDAQPPLPNQRPVLLLDTIGELAACWGLADVAFVGGSLGNRGGQNMIEPAAYGAAVLFGPNTRNFQDVVDALLERGGARVVADGSDLTQRLTELLDDPATAHSLGDAARGLVLARQGATRFTVDVLQELLPIELLERTDDDTETVAADAA